MDTREIAKKYRLTHWKKILQERIRRGQTIKEYCREEKINRNTFFYWQKKLRETTIAAMKEQKPTELIVQDWQRLEPVEIPQCETPSSLRRVSVICGFPLTPFFVCEDFSLNRNE